MSEANRYAALADAGAAGGAEAVMARVREYQRRYVLLCRAHGVGNHPLTGAPPRQRPLLDRTLGWLDRHHPEFVAGEKALHAEFADVMGTMTNARNVVFSEAELTA